MSQIWLQVKGDHLDMSDVMTMAWCQGHLDKAILVHWALHLSADDCQRSGKKVPPLGFGMAKRYRRDRPGATASRSTTWKAGGRRPSC